MKIAIVKLSALGDIIHAMIVLQYIKKNIPDAQIDWFVEEKFVGILENNPHIHALYPLRLKNNKRHVFKEYQKLKTISKQNQYDLVLDLQGLIKSALVARILSPNCVGFDKQSLREPLAAFFYKTSFHVPYEENVIMRNLKLTCKALNIDIPDIQTKEPFLFSTHESDIAPTLLVITGSSWQSKVYPKEHFVTILNALHVKSFIAWGNEKEKTDAQFICDHTNATMLPKMSLNELKTIVQNSQLVIGADSGPTHMAWALGRPSITIFGPTPSERNTVTTAINLTIDCEKAINARDINKHDFCIQQIDPLKIIALAKELLPC
ncbi:lipopolysaccharide heptosyltransferase I [Sulfurospirillum diekertiae]|uniref:Lipopolysaccharide heptosyltransferase 1 n=1 Tax=Sulfurospirillum diekertiae TaxID=1854492 RepID=A0A6G9VSQ5_9BACT|nr:lipopolysaccharide heptosyltransferase I [Sulfurospirillum diekertiae]QIR75403.1 lipopolysaccharide heptosyltransferase I [Sulfurospirillum diekertiae]QIR78054.1 lipopolysaccharide heptosyltransferase I [Sulfurospirillum diekertiae]